ncbi:9328_t:CDS:2, partial [Funneliformis geosporum]
TPKPIIPIPEVISLVISCSRCLLRAGALVLQSLQQAVIFFFLPVCGSNQSF